MIYLEYPSSHERLPIIPYSGHCSRALSFVELPDLYFAIGKTSPWSEDETTNPNFIPPECDINVQTLEELVGMKKITKRQIVMPDDKGDIEYRDSRWKYVSEAEAVEKNARWVYLETTIYSTDLPIVGYRQIGIFSRVKKADGIADNKIVLLPDEIADIGILEFINNRKVATRQMDTKDVFQVILEF